MKYTKMILCGLTGFLLGGSTFYGIDLNTTQHSSPIVQKEKEIQYVEVEKPIIQEVVKEIETIKEIPIIQEVVREVPKYITEYVEVEKPIIQGIAQM